MLKKYLPVLLCCLTIGAKAQSVQDVVNAEKAFAAFAQTNNTRDAFLNFMDADGLVFSNGAPQNAIESWKSKPAGPAKLLWEPAFAGIAASGDIGFTTGPWQFKKTMRDTALASGVFTSVWRKNTNGEWKNIVDMGYALAKPAYKNPQIKISKIIAASDKQTTDPIAIDQHYIDAYNKNGKTALADVLLPDSWLNMNALLPFTTAAQHTEAIAAIPDGLIMKPLGGGLSKAGDVAYVYGSVNYKTDKENYLRVWQQTPAGWKVVLQVLLW
jgi:ketosteroid isomerase-like protein